MNMWLVRAGENAFLFDDFKELNVVAIGWDTGDLSNMNKEEIRQELYNHYFYDDSHMPMNLGQVNKFVNEIKNEDLVITTNNNQPKVLLVGKINSDYYFSDIISRKS